MTQKNDVFHGSNNFGARHHNLFKAFKKLSASKLSILLGQEPFSQRHPLPPSGNNETAQALDGTVHESMKPSLTSRVSVTLLHLGESISSSTTLSAIRAAFFLILPFLFINSLGILFTSFPLEGYKAFMTQFFGTQWHSYIAPLMTISKLIISPLVAFGIGHHLAKKFNDDHPKLHVGTNMVGFVCIAAFFGMLPLEQVRPLEFWSGTAGLFVAIIVSFPISKLFFALFSCKYLRIHWPGSASGLMVTQGFNAFLPGILTILLCVALSQTVTALTGQPLYEFLYAISVMPFTALSMGLEQTLLHVFSMQILWFMGFHGAHMLRDIAYGIYDGTMEANATAALNSIEIPHIITDTFMDTFVFMGGAGAGMALVGALLFFGKTPANRKLALLCLIPCIFNINEVLLFGAPIVLNPILFIPFLLTPLILTVTSYVTVAAGLVPKTIVAVEWTTPILMNGYLATDSFSAVILQCVNLAIGMAIYAPFIKFSNQVKKEQFNHLFETLLQRATSTITDSRQYINYNDDAGALARSLVLEMEHALKTGDGFYLMLQPQVCARTGDVVSAESLVRWRTKGYGTIPTPITIAIAEASGLIQPLGLWIFNEACRLRKQWMNEGFTDIILSVNVSGAQLEDSFAEKLQSIMLKHKLPFGSVEIEVTESRMIGSSIDESKALMDLHTSGFPLAIDDFGMGHSSLKYLRKFPVSVVKIDGAIVKDVLTNPICADIISTITKLCRARNMRCIAEFVETEKHAEKLRELDCDLFQGYLYSAPLMPSECLHYIYKINNHNRLF